MVLAGPGAYPEPLMDTARPTARSFAVRTLGCQMNAHDSERMAGLLAADGMVPALDPSEADVVVFNTCAVRENADNRLYGNLGLLAPRKREQPDLQIAVGGCLAQKDREEIIRRAPWVDVVFGTHNVEALPALLRRARVAHQAQVEIAESLEVFPSTLPAARESDHAAWVAISVGCNNTCTFCIVPALRGRERDRRAGDILAEVRALAEQGVVEVTLLGQNVNAYGVEFGERGAFAALLRQVGTVPGLRRVRFTSPHPRDFTPDVIEAMAQTATVMPHLHMPLQSGSDAVLRRMRRSYRSAKFLDIVADVRAAMPQAAITTDIIVGFPGETESDFADTLDVVRQARFAGAFTFQYSKRPGTPAAAMPDQVPADVVAQRYRRLQSLVEEIAWRENQQFIGRRVEVLITTGDGRKDDRTARRSGRAADNRLVHVTVPEDAAVRPGDLVTAEVTYAAPHHLIADRFLAVERTGAGAAVAADGHGCSLTADGAQRPGGPGDAVSAPIAESGREDCRTGWPTSRRLPGRCRPG